MAVGVRVGVVLLTLWAPNSCWYRDTLLPSAAGKLADDAVPLDTLAVPVDASRLSEPDDPALSQVDLRRLLSGEQ